MTIADTLSISFGKETHEHYFTFGLVNLESNVGKQFLLHKYYIKSLDASHNSASIIKHLNQYQQNFKINEGDVQKTNCKILINVQNNL